MCIMMILNMGIILKYGYYDKLRYAIMIILLYGYNIIKRV